MKILVTGGTGFTGSHLVRRLLDKGHQVRALDNQEGLFLEELRQHGAEVTLGSVTDESLVNELVKDCEVVFHLAAAFREVNASHRHYQDVNVQGTQNIADAAHRFGVRKLVYCSTCGVHGNLKDVPGDEESPIDPADYYQRAKYGGEEVVQSFVQRGLDAVIIRPAAIYGPGDPQRFAMLFRMVKQGRFLMFGSGETLYHPLYIDNLIDAFELAAEADGVAGKAYLIADEQYWSLNDLVRHVAAALEMPVRIRHLPYRPLWCSALLCEMVCKPLRLSPPIFRRRVVWFRHDRAFSIERARRDLRYQPRIGISQGLQNAAQWYRQQQIV